MAETLEALGAESVERIGQIAKELAGYGLAVSVPHMHSAKGDRSPLPASMVALEQDCVVSFIDVQDIPLGAEPVGWRWIDGELVAFAHCCGNHDLHCV